MIMEIARRFLRIIPGGLSFARWLWFNLKLKSKIKNKNISQILVLYIKQIYGETMSPFLDLVRILDTHNIVSRYSFTHSSNSLALKYLPIMGILPAMCSHDTNGR